MKSFAHTRYKYYHYDYQLIVYTYITENLIQMIFNEIARYWYKNKKCIYLHFLFRQSFTSNNASMVKRTSFNLKQYPNSYYNKIIWLMYFVDHLSK